MDNHECCHSHHHWIKLVGILALCAIVIVAILRDKIVNPDFRSVTVTGQGRVAYKPDMAKITLGVQIDKVAKAEDTLNRLNGAMTKVMTAVKALGVAEEDVVTQNYTLLPQYDYKTMNVTTDYGVPGTKAISGVDTATMIAPAAIEPAARTQTSRESVLTIVNYSANEQVVITVRDLANHQDLLGKIITAANASGANQVVGIAFSLSNVEDVKQQARIKAIADAKNKATALAQAAGVKLKDITGWYENFLKGGYGGDMPNAAMGLGGYGGGAPDPQITLGDNEVMVEIGVTYKISD